MNQEQFRELFVTASEEVADRFYPKNEEGVLEKDS